VNQKRFKAEQIVAVLQQSEAGVPLAELLRRVGVSQQTFYQWKKQSVGLGKEFKVRLKAVARKRIAAIRFFSYGALAMERARVLPFRSEPSRERRVKLANCPASRRRPCVSLTLLPSRWVEDLHLQAIEHARHTKERAGPPAPALLASWEC
jgi:putative transposase